MIKVHIGTPGLPNIFVTYFTIKKTTDSTVFISFSLADITNYFNEVNQLHKIQLEQLRQTKSGKHVEILNQLVADMEYINELIIQTIINDNSGNKQRFLDDNKISEADLRNLKFPGYNAEKLKKSVSDVIKAIQTQYPTILRYNNDPDRGGRHIAPHNVNISTVIALNLTCDVIEGSYQINLEQSNQAQQGYILYSFAPTAPPGFLIIENPINPVYMRCHNNLLTRINFRLTDQSNNLIDLQEEVLVISLFVKS